MNTLIWDLLTKAVKARDAATKLAYLDQIERLAFCDAGEWTAGDDERLRSSWGNTSASRIAEALGRPTQQVFARAKALGLPSVRGGDRAGVHWTDHESDFLRQQWGIMSPAEIAGRLGRSTQGILKKAERLGLP
jgi:hypothetical protein